MNKEKLVAKCKKHKKLLTGLGLTIAGGVVGYAIGNNKALIRMLKNRDAADGVISVLDDLIYRCKYETSGVYVNKKLDNLKPDDLGELGKVMLERGVPNDFEFTHVIAIGPSTK